MNKDIKSVKVVYATPEEVFSTSLDITEETTYEKAIQKSGVLEKFPEINLSEQKIGVYSEFKKLDASVQSGDRIEIYRPAKGEKPKLRKSVK